MEKKAAPGSRQDNQVQEQDQVQEQNNQEQDPKQDLKQNQEKGPKQNQEQDPKQNQKQKQKQDDQEQKENLPCPAERNPAGSRTVYDSSPNPGGTKYPDLPGEPPGSALYGLSSEKRQEGYTLQDYYALPDDQRAELIDGVFYDMAAPTSAHQRILAILISLFETFVSGNRGSCQVFMAPCDVQLDEDDYTMLQPDLMVICDRGKIRMRGIIGAPDLVIEILSPSTKDKDTTIKVAKYCSAGVREYWLIDPDRETVLVYLFASSRFPIYYTFDDIVPVSIWNEELKIDFSGIRKKIAYLYKKAGQ